MDKKKIVRSILFFLLGAFIFWYVYRDLELSELGNQLHNLKWKWIALSLLFNLLSQYIRALRWKSLIIPMNYFPKTINLFLSVLVMSVTNLIIPRAGEIARLGAVNRVEKIPFSKLFGTALVERLTDLLILILIAVSLLAWQFDNFQRMISLPGINLNSGENKGWLTGAGIFILVIIILYFISVKFGWKKKITGRLKKFGRNLAEGFSTISRVESKALYIIYSLFIFLLYFAMMYVLIYAYPPVDDLSLGQAAFTFGFSTLAFLIPVQAGIGAWHYLVIQSLLMFGIGSSAGKVFALVAHSFTLMVYLIIGSIAIIVFPLVNQNGNIRMNK